MYVVLFCSSMIRMLAYIRKFGNGWVHVRSVFCYYAYNRSIARVNGTGWMSHITLLIDVTHDVEQPGGCTIYGHIAIIPCKFSHS